MIAERSNVHADPFQSAERDDLHRALRYIVIIIMFTLPQKLLLLCQNVGILQKTLENRKQRIQFILIRHFFVSSI